MMKYDPTGKWIQVGRYWVRLSDGYRLPIIQGGGKSTTVQNARYAFGDDDGTESGHTLDTENTNRTDQAMDQTFMIRIQVEETAGGTENQGFALYMQKNGTGGFVAVPYSATNSGIRLIDDNSSRVDDTNTTERLTAGSGTFTAGKYDSGALGVGTSAVSLSSNYTDLEFCVYIDSANATSGDDFELRVEFSDGTDLDGYPGSYPTVTAGAAVVNSGAILGGVGTITPLAEVIHQAQSTLAGSGTVAAVGTVTGNEVTFTDLDTPDINDSTNLTSYLTASWTPPTDADSLIGVFIHSRDLLSTTDTPTVTGNSLTWVQIGSTYSSGGDGGGMSFFAANPSGASTGQTTIAFGDDQTHCVALFFQMKNTDVASSGVSGCFPQNIVSNGDNTTTDTSGSVTLSAAASADNRPASFVWHSIEEAVTERTNWTEFDEATGVGQARGINLQVRTDAFETTASGSWSTAADWAVIATEVSAKGGGVTHQAQAALNGVGSVTPLAEVVHQAQSTLAGSGTLAAIGVLQHEAQSTLAGVGTLAAIGQRLANSGAVLDGVGSITPLAEVVHQAQSTLAGTGTITAFPTAQGTFNSGAVLDGVGSITPLAEVVHQAQSTLAGAGTLAAVGSVTKTGASILAGTGTLVGIAEVVHQAQSTLAGTGTLTAVGQRLANSGAVLDGIGAITPLAEVVHQAQSTLDGSGTVTAFPSKVTPADLGAAVLDGVGTLTGVAEVVHQAQSTLAGSGALTGEPSHILASGSTLAGIGTIAGVPTLQHESQSILDGIGTLTGVAEVIHQAQSTLAGSGTITPLAEVIHQAQSILAGSGTITGVGSALGEILGRAVLDGVGTLTGVAEVIHQAQSILAGSGTLDAIGQRLTNSGAVLDGVGTITSTAEVVHQAQSTLDGVGTIAAVGSVVTLDVTGAAVLDGSGAITGDPAAVFVSAATFAGNGTITSTAEVIHQAQSTLSGIGTLVAVGAVGQFGSVTLSGVGALSGVGLVERGGFASLAGSANLVSGGIMTYGGASILDGIASFAPNGTLIGVGATTFDILRYRVEELVLTKEDE